MVISKQIKTWILGIVAIGLLGSSVGAASQVLKVSLLQDPPNLDSMKSTDTISFWVLGHTMEGLTRYNDEGEIVPGVAERWDIDAKKATFYLRKNAKWSDGKPVTAQDFVFAWQRVVDTKTASQYAFILSPIKNAEAITNGKMPVSALGVKAVNDHVLEVQFEKPCGYFLGLTSFATYFPARRDFVEKVGDKFASSPKLMLYNGPFELTKWVRGANLQLKKNPLYWNQKTIKLDMIDVPYITTDNTARLNFYKDKKIDILDSLRQEDLKVAAKERYKMKPFPTGSVYYLEYNFRKGRVTNNKNLRKAIQLVFNQNEYIQKVIGIPGTKAAHSIIPHWLQAKKKKWRQEYRLKPVRRDLAQAKKFLEAAKKELGLKEIPPLQWLCSDTPTAAKEAEYFQELLKKTLGLEIRIDKQIFKQRLAKMTSGDFDIVSAGWGPDFNDPMTFAELYASWNENNRGRWRNETYDQFIRKAANTVDRAKRMDAMHSAELLLLEELPIMPMYERTEIYVARPYVKGVIRRQVGTDPDYTHAYLTK